MSDANGACLAKVGSLAVACGVSTASVSRFSKSLGYAGFKQFQLDLAAALVQSSDVTLEDFSRDASPESIVQRVFEYNRQSLAETARVLDQRILIREARHKQLRVPGQVAAVVCSAACDALAYAHAATDESGTCLNIVHRDNSQW